MSRILIVGGSSGIGEALINQLSDHHECINISRRAINPANQLSEQYNLDVLEEDLPDLEHLDGLVYCPGSINLKPIGSLKEIDFINDYKINVLGAVKVVKKYFKTLKKSKHASIVLFSTVAVQQGMPFHSSIAAAKGAVEGLTKSLAAEFAPNIRVNCIAPSITDTPLAASILKNEKSRENILQRHPLKKILSADEVASMANFLLGKQAAGISGQIIGIDAGLSSLRP